jgi:hypothetical protein
VSECLDAGRNPKCREDLGEFFLRRRDDDTLTVHETDLPFT